MTNCPNLTVNLISIGQIKPHLHYGVNSREWWVMKSKSKPEEDAWLQIGKFGMG